MKKHSLTSKLALVLTAAAIAVVPVSAAADPLPAQQASQAPAASVVSGIVVDENGEPLTGVTVAEKGKPSNATMTNLDGEFRLGVRPGASIRVSYVGYVPREVSTKGARPGFKIAMQPDDNVLDEVVVVGYGAQKKVSVTGSVASIKTDDIKKNAAPNLAATLSGRLPGLATMQTTGRPGADEVTMYLRGAGTVNGSHPLILIDGVPRDGIGHLDPNEVESVTVLKDASATAVFGVRGANGVILVTTRRGQAGTMELSASFDYSLQRFTTSTDRIHSWEFAELRNEAFLNDNPGGEAPYTPYMIEMYRNGKNRVFYPDVYPMDYFFKKWAPQIRANLNMNGGSDRMTYFVNVGYVGQSGQFKTEDSKELGYDPSYNMNRYTFRSNVDVNLASNLKLSVNLASYLEKVNSPQATDLYGGNVESMTADLFARAISMPPTSQGPLTVGGYFTPDGTPVPAGKVVSPSDVSDPKDNKFADMNYRGYQRSTNLSLNSSVILDWGLDFITKGLSTKFMVSFDAFSTTTTSASRMYDLYQAYPARNPGDECTYMAIRLNQNDVLSSPRRSSASNYYLNLQYSINYARTFGLNRVTAMALVQRDNWQTSAPDLPYNMLGFSGRVTYDFDSRYLAEINVGYNGSEQFSRKHRFGFFPAFSAGWVASNEAFFPRNRVLTHLKLRGSVGKVGNDKLGASRFLYLSSITMGGGTIPSLGRGQAVYIGKIGNEDLTWETAIKQNYGIDFKFFDNLSLSFDYFTEKRDDILITRGTVPALQGVPLGDLPKVNMGKIDNSGFEIDGRYTNRFGEFLVSVNGNFGYNKNKIVEIDEARLSEDYACRYRQTGYSVGQQFGYTIDRSNGNGFINTPEELEWAKKAYKMGTPRMGDFLYKDVNGDGEINDKDYLPIGYSNIPRITYGFGGSVEWRGIDFSVFFSGLAKASRLYNSWGVSETVGTGYFNEQHLHAWTPERYAAGEEISWPALGTVANVSMQPNDFFIMDRSFLRLKSIELGYSLPQKWLKKIGMTTCRFHVSGNNLVTWKKIKQKTIDPEQYWEASYPLNKLVNFGVNLVF